MSGSAFARKNPEFDWKMVDSILASQQQPQQPTLMAAGSGESAQTRGALIKDAGFKPEDFAPDVPRGALSEPPSQSKGFNERTMTQAQRDAMLKQQLKDQEAARQAAGNYRKR
jgi:hypothetical protein